MILESKNNILKQKDNLCDVKLVCGSYLDLDIPDNSVIYCDPPYEGTLGYKNKFNHDEFWDWCREMSMCHSVYVSEYTAPNDFNCIYSRDSKVSINLNNYAVKVEKLFQFSGCN